MPRKLSPQQAESGLFLLRQAQKSDQLSKQQERELIAQAKRGDRQAMQRLVLSCMLFMFKAVGRMTDHGVEEDDLLQECALICMKAVEHFDLQRDERLITYLRKWLLRVRSNCKKRAPTVRSLSTAQRRQAFAMHRIEEKLEQALGGAVDSIDLANELGISEAKLNTLQQAQYSCLRLDDLAGPDTRQTYLEKLPDDRLTPDQCADVRLTLRRAKALLIQAIQETLTMQERDVIKRRYFTPEPESQRKIGLSYGLTNSRIGQIEQQALRKIRQWLQSRDCEECLLAGHQLLQDLSDQPGFQPIQQTESRLATNQISLD